jgi:putative ABC transport system permease protein
VRWSDLRLRLAALVRRRRTDEELEDELQFHLAMEASKHQAHGASAQDARRLAHLQFGGLERVREECRTARGLDVLETTLQDVRYACREFRRQPAFTTTIIATIALGLGLNAALFTIFNHYVLRPFAIRDPHRVFAVSWLDRSGGRHGFAWPEYQRISTDGSSVAELAATRFLYARVDGRAMVGQFVTGNYFTLLGVGASLGRTIGADEDRTSGDVIMLSEATWRDSYGGDPRILGKTVLVRGRPMEVIGVAQPGFDDLGDTPIQYWAPLAALPRLDPGIDLFTSPHSDALRVIARIRSDVSPEAAGSALTVVVRRMTMPLAMEERAVSARLESRATRVRLSREMAAVFSPLVVAFALVLCLSCGNVANMLLARGIARQRDLGTRLSIGASRGRIVRQLLTESAILGVSAAIVSLLLSQLLIAGAVRTMYVTLPADMVEIIHTEPLTMDVRVVGGMLLAGVVSAVLFGLAPALQATRADVRLMIRGELAQGVPASRLRTWLAAGQVAICVLLVTSAGILLRSAAAITRFDVGFMPGRLIVARLVDRARPAAMRALDTERAVTRIAAAQFTPMNGILPGLALSAEDGGATIRAWYNRVSPEYFDLLGVRLTEGRSFSDDEARQGSAVAIVSEATARQLWRGASAVGRSLRIRPESSRQKAGLPAVETLRVVGVAADIVSCCVRYGKDPAIVYFPATPAMQGTSLLLETRGDVSRVRQDLEIALDRAAPGAVDEMHPLDQYVAAGVYPFRAASWIVGALAGLALALTLSGIYGVLSCLVSQRTCELGVRMAVGATTGAIARLVVADALRVVALGGAVGGVLVLSLCTLIGSQVPFVNLADPRVYALTIGIIIGTSMIAAAVPAWRAARLDPVASLRRE